MLQFLSRVPTVISNDSHQRCCDQQAALDPMFLVFGTYVYCMDFEASTEGLFQVVNLASVFYMDRDNKSSNVPDVSATD